MDSALNIMIVEDEALYAMLLKMEIRKMGWRVCSVCASGEEAVDQALSLKPDLILMDIGLAGAMNGLEAAREILSHYPARIVFMTGYGTPETEKAARALNPVAFYEKPVIFADLKEKLA